MARLLGRIPDGAVAAAVALGVFLLQLPFRLHWVNLTDEGAILQDATDILAGRTLYVDAIHPAFPGVFFLTAAAFALGGATFETARTLACLVFAATAGVAYLIGRWWLRPAGALALVTLFVAYRVWAFPHWHMVSYSSLAIALLLGATALVGAAFASGRRATYVAAGVVTGLALVTKQDSGALGAVALGLAVLLAAPMPGRGRVGAAAALTAGATAVFLAALVAAALDGMLPGLVRHAVVAPLHGLRHFEYQGSPPLWPLFAQDPDVRARAFAYFPSIAVDLFWPAISGSALYRDTWWPDLAMRLAYHLPWLVPLVALPLVLPAAPADDRAAVVRRARERLAVALAVAAWLAFNRPHDWIHLLVLYPPALVVLSLLAARLGRGRRRVPVAALVTVGLVAAVAVSARVVAELRRAVASPVRSTRGTVYATAPQAASLQELVDALAAAAPPDVPLASFPYHPVVNFIAARPPLTRYYSVWPGEPDLGRTETVRRDLDARPDGLVVYNQSQVPYFQTLDAYAPELFAYLADHYRIAQTLGGQPLGFEFLLLRREPPPAGRPLAADLADVAVVVEPAAGAPRPATSAERVELVGRAVWPFRRVLRVATAPDRTVALRFPLTPGPTTRVATSYGVHPDTWARPPRFRPRFTVAVAAAGTEHPIAEATLDPFLERAHRRWTDVDVDLAPWAGTPIELVLRVAAPPDAPPFDARAAFGEPHVLD